MLMGVPACPLSKSEVGSIFGGPESQTSPWAGTPIIRTPWECPLPATITVSPLIGPNTRRGACSTPPCHVWMRNSHVDTSHHEIGEEEKVVGEDEVDRKEK